MNDLLDAISDRLKSSYYGYIFIAFLFINWREIFFLIASDENVVQRIEYFENGTTLVELIVYPAIIGATLSISGPWFKWFLNSLTAYPADKISSRSLKSEDKLVAERIRLENSRNALFEEQSRAIIEQAKKIDELQNVDDPVAREHAKIGIEELRLDRSSSTEFNSDKNRSLERIAQSHENLAELYRQQEKYEEAQNHQMQALEIRQQLHRG